jgi:hypothetical protein
MTIAVTALGSNSSGVITTNTLTITPASITAGAEIIVAAGHTTAGSPTVTGVSDTLSNTYTLVQQSSAGAPYMSIWKCDNATGGSSPTITVTLSLTHVDWACAAVQATGVLTSGALDANPTYASGTSTTPSNSTGVLAQASEVVIAAVQVSPSVNGAFTPDAAFTTVANLTGGNRITFYMGYDIVASTSSVTFTGTADGNDAWKCLMASFKGAAPATSPFGFNMPMMGM